MLKSGPSARFVVTRGIIASVEGTSLVGGFGEKKIFKKLGGYETLFSARVMRYVSEKSTLNT